MKIAVLLIVALATFCSSAMEDTNSTSGENEQLTEQTPYIIGGEFAKPNEFPFLGMIAPGKHAHCGATILTSRWALTAAHCINDGAQYYVGVSPTGRIQEAVWYSVEKMYKHPHYGRHGAFRGDIALAKLKNPIKFIPGKIEPLCLKDESDIHLSWKDEFEATAIGRGLISKLFFEHTFEKGVKKIQLKPDRCGIYQGLEGASKLPEDAWNRNDMYCMRDVKKWLANSKWKVRPWWKKDPEADAFEKPYTGAAGGGAGGDSGSPLLYKGRDGKWKVIGVFSHTTGTGKGGKDGVYHTHYIKTWGYMPWINSVTKNENSC